MKMRINIPLRYISYNERRHPSEFHDCEKNGLMEIYDEYVTIDTDDWNFLYDDDMYGAGLATKCKSHGRSMCSFSLAWEFNHISSMPELIIRCDLENPVV